MKTLKIIRLILLATLSVLIVVGAGDVNAATLPAKHHHSKILLKPKYATFSPEQIKALHILMAQTGARITDRADSVMIAGIHSHATRTKAKSHLSRYPKQNSKLILPQPLTDEQIAAKAIPDIVALTAYGVDGKPIATGTGFVVESGGWIVTNLHVIQGAAQVTARTSSGDVLPVTYVIVTDPANDLAMIQADHNFPYQLPYSKHAVQLGEHVVCVGNPEGLEDTVSVGNISGIRSYQGNTVYQTSAPISPGSSGGVLLDRTGSVVGVTSFFLVDGQNLNFARPAYYIYKLFDSLHKYPLSITNWKDYVAEENDHVHQPLDAGIPLGSSDTVTQKNDQIVNPFTGLMRVKVIVTTNRVLTGVDNDAIQDQVEQNLRKIGLQVAYDAPSVIHVNIMSYGPSWVDVSLWDNVCSVSKPYYCLSNVPLWETETKPKVYSLDTLPSGVDQMLLEAMSQLDKGYQDSKLMQNVGPPIDDSHLNFYKQNNSNIVLAGLRKVRVTVEPQFVLAEGDIHPDTIKSTAEQALTKIGLQISDDARTTIRIEPSVEVQDGTNWFCSTKITVLEDVRSIHASHGIIPHIEIILFPGGNWIGSKDDASPAISRLSSDNINNFCNAYTAANSAHSVPHL